MLDFDLYTSGILWQNKQFQTFFREIEACFQFLTNVALPSSQYVAYQKNVAYVLFTTLPNLTLFTDTAQ